MAPMGTTPPTRTSITVSVDAMGGDRGPEAVVGGLALSARRNPDIRFILHGDAARLTPLVARAGEALKDRCEVRHADRTITMDEKPSQVVRNGQDSSMWSAVEAVRAGDAAVAVSCGNTGALMALSMLRLRRLPGVNRPAIACLWPSRNPAGFNVMLDVGADVRADAEDLMRFALMGASYARNGLGVKHPRVGLLNVGTEEHKGRPELRAALDLIAGAAVRGGYECVGFIEGGDIPGNKADVIVTDGFTGNVALKTGEGTAGLIRDFLRETFRETLLARVGALFALNSLRRLQKRTDPRRVNGGVFLGLNGTVIKSHGSADAVGVSAAVKLAFELAQSGFLDRLAARIASGEAPAVAIAPEAGGEAAS